MIAGESSPETNRITRPYPNFPKLGRRGTPSFPPVLSQRLSEVGGEGITLGRSCGARDEELGRLIASDGGGCLLRQGKRNTGVPAIRVDGAANHDNAAMMASTVSMTSTRGDVDLGLRAFVLTWSAGLCVTGLKPDERGPWVGDCRLRWQSLQYAPWG